MYKFEIWDHRGLIRLKTDPYGTAFEAPPNNASIVCNTRRHHWGDAAWLEQRQAQAGQLDRPISIYEVHPGSWRRVVEDAGAAADLPRAGAGAGRLCQRDGLHPRRAHAAGGASVRRIVGLPGDGVFRADVSLRLAGGFCVVCGPPASTRHRRHPRLGAGPFSPRQFRPGRVRWEPSVRARRSAPGGPPGLGHADLQLRAERGALFPGGERPGLVRPLPHRRAARRRRRVDAVPRLLPPAKASGSRTSSAGARTSRRSIFSGRRTIWCTSTTPAR